MRFPKKNYHLTRKVVFSIGTTHCNILQHTATHCNANPHICSIKLVFSMGTTRSATHCNPLQHKKPYVCSVGRNTLLSSDFELNKRPRILIFLNTQWMWSKNLTHTYTHTYIYTYTHTRTTHISGRWAVAGATVAPVWSFSEVWDRVL